MITKHPGIKNITFRLYYQLDLIGVQPGTHTAEITLMEMNRLVVSGIMPPVIKDHIREACSKSEEIVEEEEE